MVHLREHHLEAAYLCRMEEAGLLRRDDVGPVLRHLGEVCPACAAVLARWQESEAHRQSASDYGPSFARLRKLASAASTTAQDRWRDQERVAKLLMQPSETQRELVERDPSLASSGVVNVLLAQSREALAAANPRAANVAELAELAAHRLPRATCPQALQLDFLAESQLLAAQAYLARGDLSAPMRLLGLAEALVEHGAGSPLVEIELQATAGLLAMAFNDRPASLRAWAEIQTLARKIRDPVLLRQALEAETWVQGAASCLPGSITTASPSAWVAVLKGLHQLRIRQAGPDAIH